MVQMALIRGLLMTGPEAIERLYQADISRKRAAEMLGLHRNTLTRWARGEGRPCGPAVVLIEAMTDERSALRLVRDLLNGPG